MTISHLTVPTLQALGTTYIVRWDEGVVIRLDRLYQHRDYQVDAEVRYLTRWNYHLICWGRYAPRLPRLGVLLYQTFLR